MSKEIDAFPKPAGGDDGMTLRDYFAAKFAAAQATATSADSNFIQPDYAYPVAGQEAAETVAQKIARNAYAMADAMLAARNA
jgi:hypothetical protein